MLHNKYQTILILAIHLTISCEKTEACFTAHRDLITLVHVGQCNCLFGSFIHSFKLLEEPQFEKHHISLIIVVLFCLS